MSRSYMPSGSVYPSRAVKFDTSKTGGYVNQAVAGETPCGISQPGVRQPPISGLDDGYAGIADSKEIEVFEENDICWAEIGAAVTFGDFLKPSTNGVLITSSGDGDIYVARALQSGTASGQLVRVKVTIGFRG